MRVKFLIALAIASVLLLCSAGAAMAQVAPGCITGIPTADQLTAAANNEIAAFGFPDIDAQATSISDIAALDSNSAVCGGCGLEAPICGVNGECPDCTCVETTTVFPGPQVNLACPVVNTVAVPVNLVSPMIAPVFPTINLAPQATLALPQINTKLNCFDITCGCLAAPIDP